MSQEKGPRPRPSISPQLQEGGVPAVAVVAMGFIGLKEGNI